MAIRTEKPPQALSITMASPEMVPFVKTGGLADAVGALSTVLSEAGCRVSAVLPAYRPILARYIAGTKPIKQVRIDIGGRQVSGQIYSHNINPLFDVYFIRANQYFDRDGLYGTSTGDYVDNAERFAFFSKAAIEVARLAGSRILHLHDWQAAPAAAMLKLLPEIYPKQIGLKTVLTVHNLAYQGLFDFGHWPALGLEAAHFNPDQLEFYGRINYLKSGLVNADRLTTVSPTYAQEIQRDGCGFGLEGVLKQRAADLFGILNGADFATWNPETDPMISCRYSTADLTGKTECKKALQLCLGLEADAQMPLACMVTRVVEAKGIDLVAEIIDDLVDCGFQFVLIGSGESRYEEFFLGLAKRHSGRVAVKIGFDENLAHQAIAGADMLLMPSLREPCGLTQMYALRYGTVPIVHCTGGLADTVAPFDATERTGTGFVFQHASSYAFFKVIKDALAVYSQKAEWQALISRGMTADHSWRRSVRAYLDLYRGLLENES